MRSALYYPHTEIQSENLLCTALLLYDHLEFLVPDDRYQPYYGDPLFAEAFELFGKKHVPNDYEKKQTHQNVEQFLAAPKIPKCLLYDPELAAPEFGLYPEKLLPETWDLLWRRRIIDKPPEPALTDPPLLTWKPQPAVDPPLVPAAGLSLLAILADSCAGDTKQRITDEANAYKSLSELLCHPVVDKDWDDLGASEVLVNVNLPLVDVREVGLRRILEFRKKEATEKGHAIRQLRHRYLDRVDAHLKAVMNILGKNPRDLDEQNRIFTEEMRDDLRTLADELRFEQRDVLLSKIFSKEVFCAIAAAAAGLGALVAPQLAAHLAGYTISTLSGTVTIAGLLSAQNRFAKNRRDILAKHPTAFVYELRGGFTESS